MAAELDIKKAKAILDGSVARVRERARGIAYRVRPFLASEQQRLLDEVVRCDDPRRILAGTLFLGAKDFLTFVKLESYRETLLPSITRLSGLLTRIHVEMNRLDRAELMYEIAKRKCAAESPAGDHEASTKSANASA